MTQERGSKQLPFQTVSERINDVVRYYRIEAVVRTFNFHSDRFTACTPFVRGSFRRKRSAPIKAVITQPKSVSVARFRCGIIEPVVVYT